LRRLPQLLFKVSRATAASGCRTPQKNMLTQCIICGILFDPACPRAVLFDNSTRAKALGLSSIREVSEFLRWDVKVLVVVLDLVPNGTKAQPRNGTEQKQKAADRQPQVTEN